MSGKKISIFLIALIVASAGFFWYRSHTSKNKIVPLANKPTATENNAIPPDQNAVDNTSSDQTDASAGDNSDTAQADFNALCEKGEWVKIADLSGEMTTVSGTLRKVYPDDEASKEFQNYPYYLEGSEKIALTGKDQTKIDNFEDREVEVEGVKATDGKSLEIFQIHCAGAETDPNAISQRNKLLDYIAKNINAMAPRKASYQKWTVDTVDIVDKNNVYIEYYDTVEDDDNSNVDTDTRQKILVEMSAKPDGSYGAKVLAAWEMGDNDYMLKSGTDKFENAEDIVSFQYGQDTKSWSRM